MSSAPTAQLRRFAAGQAIFREGDDAKGEAFLIHSGKVAIRKRTHGREQTLRTLAEGQLFGEIALFSATPRSADAVAEGDVALFVIPGERLEHFVRTNPTLAVDLIRNLSQCVRDAEERAR
jgi:CRP/FNR family cyclic AMP-dependent transcriptional regulator